MIIDNIEIEFVKIKLTRLAREEVAFSESLLNKEVSKIKFE